MQFFKDLINNSVLLVPMCAWLVSGIIKLVIKLIVDKKFSAERVFGDGGMPSSHSATVSALAFMCGWTYGVNSGVFAIAVILAAIVTHDATGVRREAGKQAQTIKQLAAVFNEYIGEKNEQIKTEKLKELVGHTPLQVVAGVITGGIVTLVFCLIAQLPYACFA